MPVPNTITRTLELPHPQERVWAALTTLDGLTAWFSSHAVGEVIPGHDVLMTWEQYDNGQQVLAVTPQSGTRQPTVLAPVGQLAAHRAVEPLRLQEQHRIGLADRRSQHRVRVVGERR